MKNIFLPLLLTMGLAACDSSDNAVVNSADENLAGGNISIAGGLRETLARLPNIEFNGQFGHLAVCILARV